MGTSLEDMRAQLEQLRRQRASGVSRLVVRSPLTQQETEFRSDAEMAAAIADLESRIAAALKPARRIIYPTVSKGY
ncbi:phage head-tail joining protein [Xanthobacter sp. TB0139]|uniref:phage head-tail joining protein n=1 Tax=Xanthobacter sp. TB0139 TaxID=3459178 RepID=UPI004039A125